MSTDRATVERRLRRDDDELSLVLTAIAAHPMTPDDVEVVLVLERYAASKHIYRLREAGFVERTGEQRLTRALNLADVYRSTPAGNWFAQPWHGGDITAAIRRAHEAGSTPARNSGAQMWACPIHKRNFGSARGLLLHFHRHCDRITVAPREDVPQP